MDWYGKFKTMILRQDSDVKTRVHHTDIILHLGYGLTTSSRYKISHSKVRRFQKRVIDSSSDC